MNLEGKFSQLLDFFSEQMASISVVPTSGLRDPSGNTAGVDVLPDEMNDMKIRDDKVSDESGPPMFIVISYYLRQKVGCLQEMEATVVDGNGTETGHIIVTTIGGKNGQPKQVIPFNFHALCHADFVLALNFW